MSDAKVDGTHAGQPGVMRCVKCGRRVQQTEAKGASVAPCSKGGGPDGRCIFIFDKWIEAHRRRDFSRLPVNAVRTTETYADDIAKLDNE